MPEIGRGGIFGAFSRDFGCNFFLPTLYIVSIVLMYAICSVNRGGGYLGCFMPVMGVFVVCRRDLWIMACIDRRKYGANWGNISNMIYKMRGDFHFPGIFVAFMV